ncbi:hypothetical protein BGX38DRAFT_1174800, partial [Terfezia claveryi]
MSCLRSLLLLRISLEYLTRNDTSYFTLSLPPTTWHGIRDPGFNGWPFTRLLLPGPQLIHTFTGQHSAGQVEIHAISN